MAPVRSKATIPVGSARWVFDERKQVVEFGDQEAEDFAFSARNEVEWLNEHMADIFSNNQLNVTEIFKTPGKLRGKTPRTARKRNPMEVRAPLSNIFSINVRSNFSPSRDTAFYKDATTIEAADNRGSASPSKKQPGSKVVKENTDSGYHGITDDEMEIDETPITAQQIQVAQQLDDQAMSLDPPADQEKPVERASADRRTTEGSFHSAREDLPMRDTTKESSQPSTTTLEGPSVEQGHVSLDHPAKNSPSKHPYSAVQDDIEVVNNQDDKESLLDEDPDLDPSRSPSNGSSPVKPLVRKSSLTFASLPAREPLATKKSIGGRVSRTSHIDQTKPTTISRASYLGRYTGGKSLGGLRQPEIEDEVVDDTDKDDPMDLDEEDRPTLAREESDGDGKMAKLHNKSSTQRLHDRINALGKSQPARPTKSIPAAVPVVTQPDYPELPETGEELGAVQPVAGPKIGAFAAAVDEDEDDWIKPISVQSNQLKRPQLRKSHSTDVMEQISGKVSIGGEEFGLGPHDRLASRQPSPLRQVAVVDHPTNGPGHKKSASTSVLVSLARAIPPQDVNHKKTISVSNPGHCPVIDEQCLPIASVTPAGTPASRLHIEGPLSASKSKLQSIMKSARGLFTSSAGISAQAKMETLSPSSMRTRGQAQASSIDEVVSSKPLPPAPQGTLYPLLPSGTRDLGVDSPTKNSEGRKTRSSTEKDEKRREKDVKERKRLMVELERAREKERQKAAVSKEAQADIIVAQAPLATNLEETAQSRAQRPTRQSPRRQQKPDEPQRATANWELLSGSADSSDPIQPMAPPPPRTQAQQSHLQKPKDLRRPIKPAKEAASKPKPQPVSIRVGTLSHPIPLTNAALSSSLQDSLPPTQQRQTGLAKKASNASLQTSISNASLKSSVSSSSTKPKALLAAERKKEQDQKEVQRKLEQKREIERKRAAQQEEAQRREQRQRQELERQRERERSAAVEDSKNIALKQSNEKKRLDVGKKDQQRNPQRPATDLQEKAQAFATSHRAELGGGRPQPRLNAMQDCPRPPVTHPPVNPAKPPIKRVFEPDAEDEPAKPARVQGGQGFQQTDAKRRRTEDEDFHDTSIRPTINGPPIRQSNIRKDVIKPSVFSNGYNTASGVNNHNATSSLLKTSTMNQVYQQHASQSQTGRPVHPKDMAKFTNGKIPFAEAPNPPPQAYKTPLPSKQGIPGATRSSPMYPNGDNIPLDEIPTDSEDEDSEDERVKKRMLPGWVHTPELERKLREQEEIDTDALFGPIGPPNMEDIFKDKNRHHRFRSRTSSANWAGQDRLTEEEIRNDNAARERMRREGGWTFGL